MPKWLRVFFAPDEGGGGAAGEGGAEAQGEQHAAEGGQEGPKLPKFADQLPPELKTKYAKDLEGYADKKLGDVLGEHFDLKARMSQALFIPDPKTAKPEEIKAFKEKMGLPDSAAAYEFNTEAFKDIPGLEGFVAQYRDQAYAMGMNRGQAQKNLEYVLGIGKAAAESAAAERQKARETFDVRLGQALNPDGKRAPAEVGSEVQTIKNRMTLFFTKQVGDAELVKDAAARGMLYDPRWARTFAAIQAKLEDAPFHEGHGHGASSQSAGRGKMGSYSSEFSEKFGGGN